jgi:hypothetical protein
LLGHKEVAMCISIALCLCDLAAKNIIENPK